MIFLRKNPFTRSITLLCLVFISGVVLWEGVALEKKQRHTLKGLLHQKQELKSQNKPLESFEKVKESWKEIQEGLHKKVSPPLNLEAFKEDIEKRTVAFCFMNLTFQGGASKEFRPGWIQDTVTLSWASYQDQGLKQLFTLLTQAYPGLVILTSFTQQRVVVPSKEKIFDIARGTAPPFFKTHCTFLWIHKELLS